MYLLDPRHLFRERRRLLAREARDARLARGLGAARPENAGGRYATALYLLAALVAASLMLVAQPAHAVTTFTVNSTSDSGDSNVGDRECDFLASAAGDQCSLRAAIQESNAATFESTVIDFDIPTNVIDDGVRTISPRAPLPPITKSVIIDGYSQPGSSENTLAKGTNAVLMVELDGSNAGSFADGLHIQADDAVVRGLVINRFDSAGVRIDGDNVEIEGNFIGTDPTGTLDRGNDSIGVLVLGGASNVIGGGLPIERNLVSGNDGDGVSLNSGSEANTVLGNLVGTKRDGESDLGNEGIGVLAVDSVRNLIGSGSTGEANTIAFNGLDGVGVDSRISGAAANRVLANSIFSNAGLGINLFGGTENAAGATSNDPGDLDSGPNDLQNKPVITSAKTAGGKTTLKGKLNSTPNRTFQLHFYSNRASNEGKKFLANLSVTTDGSGNANFAFSPSSAVAVGQRVTATATDLADENTSEFSARRTVKKR